MLRYIRPLSRPFTGPTFRRLNPRASSKRTPVSQRQQKTRMLILSDTHANDLKDLSLPHADVVLHCGDLTQDSQPEEFEITLAMLRALDAPLTLAIPGNHDFSLEQTYWRWTRDQIHPTRQQHRNEDAKASWELFRLAAQRDNIFMLPQGTHTFVLSLGARLRIFASPLTPRLGNWGFQYDRSNPRKWDVTPMTPDGDGAVDVVMTHGPPRGIRDGTGMMGAGAGCSGLLAAVERARPRVHCFGHIHGAWGAEVVTWKRGLGVLGKSVPSAPIFGNLVDAERSRVVMGLQAAGDGEGCFTSSSPSARVTNLCRAPPREEMDCLAVDISPVGEHAVESGAQTLFVNAAVESRARPRRLPWLIEVDLPMAVEDDVVAAIDTMSRLVL